MLGKFAVSALLASASLLVARADVVPNVPGPGIVYKAGGTCRIEWNGDQDSNTVWKNMSIQLMTGSNFEMVALTSKSCIYLLNRSLLTSLFSTAVASAQDGTVSGFFEHVCPAVRIFCF